MELCIAFSRAFELEAEFCTALIALSATRVSEPLSLQRRLSFRVSELPGSAKAEPLSLLVWSNGRGELLYMLHLSAELPGWLAAVRGEEADEEA